MWVFYVLINHTQVLAKGFLATSFGSKIEPKIVARKEVQKYLYVCDR